MTDPGVGIGGRWREIYRGGDGALYENATVMPRFFSRTARVEQIHESGPGEFTMRVTASAPATVISSEIAAPGRSIYVGGHRTPMFAGTFLSFPVPQGTSTVDVVYRPLSFYASIIVAVLAVIALIAAKPYKSHSGMANSAMSGRNGLGAAASANHHGNSRDQIV